MTTALFVLAVACIFVSGVLLYAVIKYNKLVDEYNCLMKISNLVLKAKNDEEKEELLLKMIKQNCRK